MAKPKAEPGGERLRRMHARAIVRGQQTLTPLARSALKLIARYPLLAPRDLAALLGVARNKLVAPLRALRALELVDDHDGLWVLPSGLGLLAGWLRVPARALARYSTWRLRRIGGGYTEGLQGLLRLREHNRRVAQFAAGLRTHLESLQWWDNPLEGEGPTPQSLSRRGRVVPDAIGVFRVGAHKHTPQHTTTPTHTRGRAQIRTRGLDGAAEPTRLYESMRPHVLTRPRVLTRTLWLEVDRDTMQGQRLRAKLMRYYALQQAWLSRSQRPPLILFLVDGGESRLQELRRKLRELDDRFGFRLPVWLARTDQLRAGRSGALNPLRRVWRTAHTSDGVCPFEEEPDGDPID